MSAAPKPMCILTIGFEKLLVPLEAGTKVMSLLSAAVSMEATYPGGRVVFVPVAQELRLEMEKYSPLPAGKTPATKAKP